MSTVEQNSSIFHLIIKGLRPKQQPIATNPNVAAVADNIESIEIPESGGLLAVNDGRLQRISDMPAGRADNIFALQPFRSTSGSRLLMVCPGRSRPLINSVPAPPLALLNLKDEILFPNTSECIAHVTLYNRPYLGPPPETHIGRKCPLCRSKLLKTTCTYTCYQCGQLVHYKPDGNSETNTLDCANISANCPVCHAKIYLRRGYVYLPEVY
jgi:hypothetical protein